MLSTKQTSWLAGVILTCIIPSTYAKGIPGKPTTEEALLTQTPMPHMPLTLPPSSEQAKYNLPSSKKPRLDLMEPKARQRYLEKNKNTMAVTPSCQNMDTLANYNGDALADYIVNLPDYECHYGLFSLNAMQAAKVYSTSNFNALANRFAQEARIYNGNDIKLVNLLIYLRAGYYLASNNVIPTPSASLLTTLRMPIKQLVDGDTLFIDNIKGPSTARETLTLITNMFDEAYYLNSMKKLVVRYTNSVNNPHAVDTLRQSTAAAGFTGVLTVFYYAHFRNESRFLLQNDISYPTILNDFVVNNKSALLNTDIAYQLSDTTREAFRFLQYPMLRANIKPMVNNILATTSMTGTDSDLWLAAAMSVKYNDGANCADYGTCNFETKLADAVLTHTYTCSPSIRIRSQELTVDQMQTSCGQMQTEESFFHDMLQTNRTPVANDVNTTLEVVVFNDYPNYNKYASAIFGINTNNGGMYLEGEPNVPGNQARFIAHEASWLRPVFQIWNLKHEYVHYLDGRFDMYGDFTLSTNKPTVWWIEGLAEYISKENDNQEAINTARTGTYLLSQIYGNTYSMADYVTRAYPWGYMATRFMFENHRNDVDALLTKFRIGDYDGYQTYMNYIGNRYDAEFAQWVTTATTSGTPPMPGNPTLPTCSHPYYLGKNCAITGWSSSNQSYAYIMLPNGAKNLKLWTSGDSGDVDMYLALDRYPTKISYDASSTTVGNNENIALPTPVAGHWYYIVLNAKQPFSGVSLNATYDSP